MVKSLLFSAATALGAMMHSYISSSTAATECQSKDVFSTKFQPFMLGEVINLAEDVAIFRFLLNSPNDVFNLVPCSTLQAQFKEGSNIVDQPMRFYTPITSNGTKGYFDLLVRKQRPGRFTEHLFSMNIGENLLFRTVQYKLRYRKNKWNEVGFICGGTGVCPILQFMNASLETPGDTTKLNMLFGNRSENQILMKGLLDKLAAKHRGRLYMYYTVDKLEDPNRVLNPAYQPGSKQLDLDITEQPEFSPDGKKYFHGFEGYVSIPMITATMPRPVEGSLLLVCGPDPMMTRVVGSAPGVLNAMSNGKAYQPTGAVLNNAPDVAGLLGNLGYQKEMVYRF